jgi:hypothetical protein
MDSVNGTGPLPHPATHSRISCRWVAGWGRPANYYFAGTPWGSGPVPQS